MPGWVDLNQFWKEWHPAILELVPIFLHTRLLIEKQENKANGLENESDEEDEEEEEEEEEGDDTGDNID